MMTRILPTAACLLLGLVAPAAAAAAEPPTRARSSQPLATYFTDKDYPADAIRNAQEGPVAFRLQVGADGRPYGCKVTSSSGSASLDSTTCRLVLERPRFEPARDAAGRAVPDEVDGRIVWRLDDNVMDRPESALTIWSICLFGEAAKLSSSDLPAAEIVRRSYPPCTTLEAAAAREAGRTTPLEAERAGLAGAIEEIVLQARAILNPPAETGTARSP